VTGVQTCALPILGEYIRVGLDFRWCGRALYHHLWDSRDFETLDAVRAYILHGSVQRLHALR
jgi:hypothetical protein